MGKYSSTCLSRSYGAVNIKRHRGCPPPPQLLIQCAPRVLHSEMKTPQSDCYHYPQSSGEVKNAWSFTSTPPHVFMLWYFIKHRGNFTFSFLKNLKFCYGCEHFPYSEGKADAGWPSGYLMTMYQLQER
jgi:hypothetical protein